MKTYIKKLFLLFSITTTAYAGSDMEVLLKVRALIENGKIEEARKICDSIDKVMDRSTHIECRVELGKESQRIKAIKNAERDKLVEAKWNSAECKRAQASVGFCEVKSALVGYTKLLTNKNLTEYNRNAISNALDLKAADQLRRLVSMKNLGMRAKEIDCKGVLENPPTGPACHLRD